MAYDCDEMLRDEVAAHAATRARLEQAEREREEALSAMRDWCVCVHCNARFPADALHTEDHGRTCPKHPQRVVERALAASQASERELREALEGCRVWMIDSAGRDEALPGMAHPKRIANRAKDIQAMNAVLSRAPGSTEALAAWGDRLVRAFAKQRMIQVADTEVADAVARVLDRSDTTEGGRG